MEIRHQFFREIQFLISGVFITPMFIPSGIKLLLFQILRFFEQQYRIFFPATGKFALLEKYPDNSKVGETSLSMDSSKPQEESAIPLYYKLAVQALLGSTLCLYFLYLAWFPAALLLVHVLAPRIQQRGQLGPPLSQSAKTSVSKFT